MNNCLLALCLTSLAAACGGAFDGRDHDEEASSAPAGGTGGGGESASGGRARPVGNPSQGSGSPTSGGSAGSVASAGAGGSAGASTPSEPPVGGAGGAPDPPPELLPDPLPDASCASPIADAWTQPLDAAESTWLSSFGNPSVDLESERLGLTFDDIVTRTSSFEGGYYVTHTLRLDGNTAFTPQPYGSSVAVPSLRRNGDDLELGGTAYGQSWSTSTPAGFAGTIIEGTLQAYVTSYVKADAKLFALKVQAGDVVVRSGWLAYEHEELDLGTLYLVGQNTAVGSGGSDDRIFVGTLVGCEGLTDAEIDERYEN